MSPRKKKKATRQPWHHRLPRDAKHAQVYVRVSRADHAELGRLADKFGVTMSDVVRVLAFDGDVDARLDAALHAANVNELGVA